ncbi:hypothetical protein [Syntrophomonas zehnderi]|uniref:hypothetical protein n=1 Tax=Syntrophomonas zehnderi TaxID=404335 RepID=UPI0012F98B1C|nr:hypothetical protein [Syntrophomonas zehnderi]
MDYNNKKINLALHAWQIKIAKTTDVSSNLPNHWQAIVKKIILHGTHVEITCQGKGLWNINTSRNEWEKLGLQVGSIVTLSVNTDDVHLIYS